MFVCFGAMKLFAFLEISVSRNNIAYTTREAVIGEGSSAQGFLFSG